MPVGNVDSRSEMLIGKVAFDYQDDKPSCWQASRAEAEGPLLVPTNDAVKRPFLRRVVSTSR
jgi:hypothetical protein